MYVITPVGDVWKAKLYLFSIRSIDWYVFHVSCDTSRSLASGSSLIRAEHEPEPTLRERLDLLSAASRSSRSPPIWKRLNGNAERKSAHAITITQHDILQVD